jgi:hypothetical protein
MASSHRSKADERLAEDPSQTGTGDPTGSAGGEAILPQKAWNTLRHGGRLVREEVTDPLPSVLHPLAWQQFQQMPLAGCACWLLQQLEPPTGMYRRGTRRPADAGLFDDIPSPAERDEAEKIYAELCERYSSRLASAAWLRPILAGRARWLAAHPDTRSSAWGRRMRRRKGGKHTQQRYREQGWHPLASVRKAWGLTAKGPQTDSKSISPGSKV